MRPVSILGFSQLPPSTTNVHGDEADMVQRVTSGALADAGLDRREIGFWCSGSCDYVMGRPFSFVAGLDGIGAWPPVAESHVEMDGAWALYEAWVHLQMGHVDTATIYAYGKGSLGSVDDVLTMQLDPYFMKPLDPSPLAVAALQARARLDAGLATEADFAAAVAQAQGADVGALLRAPTVASPLRAHDQAPWTDGACAIVLGAGERAQSGVAITGIAHNIDPHQLGARDLTKSPSTQRAADAAGVASGPVDFAEIHAQFSPELAILAEALGLDPTTSINPSGGALRANTPQVAGLTRIGEAAKRLRAGEGRRAVAHASQGPCLQQNLVCVLEAQ
jgi:hypothetical protein